RELLPLCSAARGRDARRSGRGGFGRRLGGRGRRRRLLILCRRLFGAVVCATRRGHARLKRDVVARLDLLFLPNRPELQRDAQAPVHVRVVAGDPVSPEDVTENAAVLADGALEDAPDVETLAEGELERAAEATARDALAGVCDEYVTVAARPIPAIRVRVESHEEGEGA